MYMCTNTEVCSGGVRSVMSWSALCCVSVDVDVSCTCDSVSRDTSMTQPGALQNMEKSNFLFQCTPATSCVSFVTH